MNLRSFGSTGSRVWPALDVPTIGSSSFRLTRTLCARVCEQSGCRLRPRCVEGVGHNQSCKRDLCAAKPFGRIARSNGDCRAGARYGATTVASACDACISCMPLGPSTKRNEAASHVYPAFGDKARIMRCTREVPHGSVHKGWRQAAGAGIGGQIMCMRPFRGSCLWSRKAAVSGEN